MKLLRAIVNGWTTSFRYPSFIVGYQRTLTVPPLSTLYGFLSSAKGNIVTPEDTKLGFVFEYECNAVDLESIYVLSDNLKAGTNINKREFLYNYTLTLYLTNIDFMNILKKPYYSLTLGRSMDIANIQNIEIVELEEKDNIPFGKTLTPFDLPKATGVYVSLPVYFNYDNIPRYPVEIKEFLMMEKMIKKYNGKKLPYDKEKNWGVYIHE